MASFYNKTVFAQLKATLHPFSIPRLTVSMSSTPSSSRGTVICAAILFAYNGIFGRRQPQIGHFPCVWFASIQIQIAPSIRALEKPPTTKRTFNAFIGWLRIKR